jgi:hypothetical protein
MDAVMDVATGLAAAIVRVRWAEEATASVTEGVTGVVDVDRCRRRICRRSMSC